MDLPDEGTGELRAGTEARGIRVLSFDDVMQTGIARPAELTLPKPDSLFTIVYSSGTTGMPKGVMTTHKNMVACHAVTQSNFDTNGITPEDVHCSYLPLSHILERSALVTGMTYGWRAGFYRGDPLTLLDDLRALQPTIFLAVPRVFNVVHQRIQASLAEATPLKRALFKIAFNRKLALVNRGAIPRDTIWDRLVFKNIQEIFGGKARMILSGGAPISPEVVQFFKVAFPLGCTVASGYGLTEVTGCLTHTIPHDVTFDHVGVPGSDGQIKLADVPELGYLSAEDRGEICVKGSTVFGGYFKDPEKTREVFDDEGWFRSGDIGQWSKNGTLQIIDRRGSIFKLSNGKFICPERIEMIYGHHPVAEQAFIYGDSLRDCLVGVISVDRDAVAKFAAKHGIGGTVESLCQNQKLKNVLLKRLQEYGAKKGLFEAEQIKSLHLVPRPFGDTEGLITPTLKLKRRQMSEAFGPEIDAMYRQLQDHHHQSASVQR